MSTSVYSSSRLSLSSRNQDLFNRPEVRRVKRILFGPVDHQATQKFIDEELKKIIVTKSEQWNFDFQKERTLSPEGLFEWRPATPKKQLTPLKRKADSEQDITEQYYEFSEADSVRPRPVKCLSPTHNGHKTQQSRITDFMKATKRPLSTADVSKKQSSSSEWNSDIPIKRPRVDIVS